jgi:hypothetical protein
MNQRTVAEAWDLYVRIVMQLAVQQCFVRYHVYLLFEKERVAIMEWVVEEKMNLFYLVMEEQILKLCQHKKLTINGSIKLIVMEFHVIVIQDIILHYQAHNLYCNHHSYLILDTPLLGLEEIICQTILITVTIVITNHLI